MPRIMMVVWEYMFHEAYSSMFFRPVPPPPFISLLLFIFISFFGSIISISLLLRKIFYLKDNIYIFIYKFSSCLLQVEK